MSEGVEFYQEQIRVHRSMPSAILAMQNQALSQFARVGFPDRHHEDWKYTSLDAFLRHRFSAPDQSPAVMIPELDLPVASDVIHLVNGTVVNLAEVTASLPKGVVVLPLMQALEEMPQRVLPQFNQILTSTHAFHFLNTAMMQAGLFIEIPAQMILERPLWINHWQTENQQAVNLRHVIVAGVGSQFDLIEDFQGQADTCYFTNSITELNLETRARVTHLKIQRESREAYHVGHLAVKQAEHSELISHVFSLGGRWVRSDVTIDFDEPFATCSMNGIYLPTDGQHIDHHTLVHHAVPNCESHQDYKGILQGHSRAVFNGRVVVAPQAQHSKAMQQNKNLLLSAQAEIDTKPQLEIFADDVICTHGATVGNLDEEALFYLATRGISRDQASQYLMRAFLNGNIRAVDNEAIANWIMQLVNEQLG